MSDAARVYAEALFEVGRDRRKLDALHEQLGELADAVAADRELQVFFFSPYFSSAEKRDGARRAISGAEPELLNFLELLIEKQRMPEIFRIRRELDDLWKRQNRRLDVTVTSAVELDPAVLASRIDGGILGGVVLQVGNMVVDASIRSRLEKLRKSVA
jgi:F-type H+-transporting ATPase subunit delta